MRYCLALDLKDDPESIENYKKYYRKENFSPEITKSIKEAGAVDMQIFLTGNRLFMIMEVDETFDFAKKAEMDTNNPRVQDWENFVSQFQQRIPWAKDDQKWVLMEKIYGLDM
jgi:L-rhamnose mutarotase